MKNHWRLWRVSLLLVLILGSLVGTRVSAADALPPGATALYPSPNERFGFGVLDGIDNYDVVPLDAGWYQNWGPNEDASHPDGLLAAHSIRVSPGGLRLNLAQIAAIAEEDPGGLWLVGNEPDMFKQDNVTPTQYAQQYREAYFAIKGFDPSAQVAAGAIVQPTPLRLGWLSAVWDAYQASFGRPMPVDVWNIHNYILQEVPGEWGCGIPPGYYGERAATYPFNSHDDLTIFQQHILAMRQWMADHGQREKPLIITEYGILFPESSGYDTARVQNFFIQTANWLLTATDPSLGYPADEDHLVQRWMWYSLDDTNFADAGNTIAGMMDPATRQMRAMGQTFAAMTTPLRRPYVNLVATRVTVQESGGVAAADAAQPVQIRSTIQNRGNAPVTTPFRVLIQDQAGTVIHSQTVNGMPMRYGGNAVVEAAWLRPAGNGWKVVVLVDTGNAVSESDEGDNRFSAGPAADLYLKSLAVIDASGRRLASQGLIGPLTLAATVKNLSSTPLAGARVQFLLAGQLLQERAVPDLAAGAGVDVAWDWTVSKVGMYNIAAELVLSPGVSDPVSENNYLGRDFLVAAQRTYLPAINGSQFQSGQSGGVECRNVLVDPGFESGALGNWNPSPFVGLINSGCFAGGYCLWMGRGLSIEDSVYQVVSVRPEATLHLSYAWAVVTIEPGPAARDTLAVEVRTGAGHLLRTVETLDNLDAHASWYTSSFDLSDLAGQTLQLYFHARNDAVNQTNFFLDEIVLEVCEKR